MKNTKYLMLVLILSISIFSCEQDSVVADYTSTNQNKIESIKSNYINFLVTKKPSGSLLIQSNATYNTQKFNKNVGYSRVTSESKKDDLIKIKGLSENYFLENNKSNIGDDNLEKLFGTNIQYSIGNSAKSNQSIYIPEYLNVEFSTETLMAGTKVVWNVDSNNQNGLVIYASYNPASQPDVELAFNNPIKIREAIFLDDIQGSYVLTTQDIERFPTNSFVSIDVMRGGFRVVEDEPVVGGLTRVNSDMQLTESESEYISE